jgi:DNA replication protein DnaC
VQRRE